MLPFAAVAEHSCQGMDDCGARNEALVKKSASLGHVQHLSDLADEGV